MQRFLILNCEIPVIFYILPSLLQVTCIVVVPGDGVNSTGSMVISFNRKDSTALVNHQWSLILDFILLLYLESLDFPLSQYSTCEDGALFLDVGKLYARALEILTLQNALNGALWQSCSSEVQLKLLTSERWMLLMLSVLLLLFGNSEHFVRTAPIGSGVLGAKDSSASTVSFMSTRNATSGSS